MRSKRWSSESGVIDHYQKHSPDNFSCRWPTLASRHDSNLLNPFPVGLCWFQLVLVDMLFYFDVNCPDEVSCRFLSAISFFSIFFHTKLKTFFRKFQKKTIFEILPKYVFWQLKIWSRSVHFKKINLFFKFSHFSVFQHLFQYSSWKLESCCFYENWYI